MAKKSSHPVYKYLKDWPSEPYKTADCDPPSEKPRPSDSEKELYRLRGSNRYRMVDFGIDLLSKQQQSIVKEILNSKKLEPFRYAILGAVLCPSKDFPVTRFVAESLIEHFPKSYQEVLEDTVDKNNANYLKKYKEILENTGLQENSPELRRTEGFLSGGRSGVFGGGFYNSPEASAINARVRYVVEGAGEDMSWWSLSGDRRAYTFSQGCFDFERPKYWLGLLDNENDGRLLDLLDDSLENLRAEKGRKEYSGYVLAGNRKTFCEALVKQSRKFTARHANFLEMRQ